MIDVQTLRASLKNEHSAMIQSHIMEQERLTEERKAIESKLNLLQRGNSNNKRSKVMKRVQDEVIQRECICPISDEFQSISPKVPGSLDDKWAEMKHEAEISRTIPQALGMNQSKLSNITTPLPTGPGIIRAYARLEQARKGESDQKYARERLEAHNATLKTNSYQISMDLAKALSHNDQLQNTIVELKEKWDDESGKMQFLMQRVDQMATKQRDQEAVLNNKQEREPLALKSNDHRMSAELKEALSRNERLQNTINELKQRQNDDSGKVHFLMEQVKQMAATQRDEETKIKNNNERERLEAVNASMKSNDPMMSTNLTQALSQNVRLQNTIDELNRKRTDDDKQVQRLMEQINQISATQRVEVGEMKSEHNRERLQADNVQLKMDGHRISMQLTQALSQNEKLQKTIEGFEKQRNDDKRHLQLLIEQVNQLTAKQHDQEDIIKRITGENEMQQINLDMYSRALKTANEANDECQEQMVISRMKFEREASQKVQTTLNNTRKQVVDLTQTNDRVFRGMSMVRSELTTAYKHLGELRRSMAEIQKVDPEHHKQVKEILCRNKKLTQHVTQLAEEQKVQNDQIEKFRKNNSALETDKAKLQSLLDKNNKAHEDNLEKIQKIAQMEQINDQLTNKLIASQRHAHELLEACHRLEAVQESDAALQQRTIKLSRENKVLVEKLKSNQDDTKKQIGGMRQINDQLSTELAEAQKQVHEALQCVEARKVSDSALQQRIQELSRQNMKFAEELKQEDADRKEEIAGMRQINDRLSNALAAAQKEVHEARQNVETLKGSEADRKEEIAGIRQINVRLSNALAAAKKEVYEALHNVETLSEAAFQRRQREDAQQLKNQLVQIQVMRQLNLDDAKQKEQRMQSLRRRNERLIDELNLVTEERNAQSANTKNEKMSDLQQQLDAAKEMVIQIQRDLITKPSLGVGALRMAFHALASRQWNLKEHLKNTQVLSNKLSVSIHDLNESNEGYQKRIAELEQELLAEKCTSESQRIVDLRQQLAAEKLTVKMMSDQRDLEARYRAQLTSGAIELDALQKVEAQNEEIEKLKMEICALETNKSRLIEDLENAQQSQQALKTDCEEIKGQVRAAKLGMSVAIIMGEKMHQQTQKHIKSLQLQRSRDKRKIQILLRMLSELRQKMEEEQCRINESTPKSEALSITLKHMDETYESATSTLVESCSILDESSILEKASSILVEGSMLGENSIVDGRSNLDDGSILEKAMIEFCATQKDDSKDDKRFDWSNKKHINLESSNCI